MKKTIKFLKLKKVKIASLDLARGIIMGGKSDGCNTENSCDENVACLPEITQSTKTSNLKDCTGSILDC